MDVYSFHSDGAKAVFADGSVHFLAESMPPAASASSRPSSACRAIAGPASTSAGIGYFRPISFSNSFSVSTGMPSSRALSSLLPGFAPAIT